MTSWPAGEGVAAVVAGQPQRSIPHLHQQPPGEPHAAVLHRRLDHRGSNSHHPALACGAQVCGYQGRWGGAAGESTVVVTILPWLAELRCVGTREDGDGMLARCLGGAALWVRGEWGTAAWDSCNFLRPSGESHASILPCRPNNQGSMGLWSSAVWILGKMGLLEKALLWSMLVLVCQAQAWGSQGHGVRLLARAWLWLLSCPGLQSLNVWQWRLGTYRQGGKGAAVLSSCISLWSYLGPDYRKVTGRFGLEKIFSRGTLFSSWLAVLYVGCSYVWSAFWKHTIAFVFCSLHSRRSKLLKDGPAFFRESVVMTLHKAKQGTWSLSAFMRTCIGMSSDGAALMV
eukprot:1156505-Pelagomonas_calceolata.AAC.10